MECKNQKMYECNDDLETHDQRNPQSVELWKVCDGVFGDHPVEVAVLLQTRKMIISLWISKLFHQEHFKGQYLFLVWGKVRFSPQLLRLTFGMQSIALGQLI